MSSNNLIDLTPKEIKSNYNKKYYNSNKENNKMCYMSRFLLLL